MNTFPWACRSLGERDPDLKQETRGPVCWSSSCSSLVLMVFARVVVSSGNTLTASDGSPDSSQKTYHYGCCSLQWMVCNQLLGNDTSRLQRKKGSGSCWSMTMLANNHIWFNHGVNQNTCACPRQGFYLITIRQWETPKAVGNSFIKKINNRGVSNRQCKRKIYTKMKLHS